MLSRARLTATVALAASAAIGLLIASNAGPLLRAAGPAIKQSSTKAVALSPEARERARRAVAGVGLILVRSVSDPPGQKARPRGSGVVVQADGVVVTNYHVIVEDKADRLYQEILFSLSADGSLSPAAIGHYHLRPVLINRLYDLALLRVVSDDRGQALPPAATFPALALADSNAVQLLDDIIVIGYPEKGGSTVTVNPGVIEGKDALENWIKTDARLIHGNSGGAAINSEGKLVGIPTKVVVATRWVDKDGDGFPDTEQPLGAVGFLRPVNLVAAMLEQVRAESLSVTRGPAAQAAPPEFATVAPVTVRGLVRSAAGQKPVAGARVGLLPAGSQDVTADNLLTWAGTNADGQFEFNKPVPPGRYSLRARAIGYEVFAREVEVSPQAASLVIELRPSP